MCPIFYKMPENLPSLRTLCITAVYLLTVITFALLGEVIKGHKRSKILMLEMAKRSLLFTLLFSQVSHSFVVAFFSVAWSQLSSK